MSRRPVFLLTDFGPESVYPGIVKAVVLAIEPGATVVDLGHGVRPFDVRDGAWHVRAAWEHLPLEAVLVAVVDPGVGGARRAIAVRAQGRTALAPDNGLLTPVLLAEPRPEVFEIRRPDLERRDRSATFHGRDVFAPIAAHLAAGLREEDLGPRIPDAIAAAGWEPAVSPGRVLGRVAHVDAFGNLVTDIERRHLATVAGSILISAGGVTIDRLSRTYGDVPAGTLLAYFGSAGTLEIAIREGFADERLGLGAGDPIVVTSGGAGA